MGWNGLPSGGPIQANHKTNIMKATITLISLTSLALIFGGCKETTVEINNEAAEGEAAEGEAAEGEAAEGE